MTFVAAAVVLALLAVSIYALVRNNEERKARERAAQDARDRQRLQAAAINWPPNLRHKTQWKEHRKEIA
jgi:hypothetical protein